MKIIHTSDIHLDSPLTSRLPADKVRERRREILSGFSRLIDEAREERAGAVIIAGDLFDSAKVTKKALDTAIEVIGASPDLTFFYVAGNHEGDALTESGRILPKNLITFGEDWSYHTAGGVTIAGRSSISEKMFDELDLPKDTTNIVILHGELRDKTVSSEAIGIKDMVGKNIDYLALGHYHSYSTTRIDERGTAVYSGTPEGRGFDEVGDKGYVVIDTDSQKLRYFFRSHAKRRLHIIPVDLSGANRWSEIGERTLRAVREIPYTDVVRVELCGRYYPTLVKDIDTLRGDFSDRFYYFEIKDSSRIAINPEDYKLDRSLKGEFIRTVTADESLDEETKEKIIACGINALMGEELFEI